MWSRSSVAAAGLFLVVGCTGSLGDPDPDTTLASLRSASTTTTSVPVTTTLRVTTTLAPISVAGRVVDPGNRPVEGATVGIGEVATTSGPDGFFALVTGESGTLNVSMPGWMPTEIEWEADSPFTVVEVTPRVVRGIRVGPGAAGDDELFDRLLSLARDTAVNTFVFDTKQEGGKLLYETVVADALASGAVEPMYDPRSRIAQAEAAGLYTITRIVVFEDSHRIRFRPEEKLAGGWLDPRSRSAWDYNIAVAVEACELGFDEIQFDYVRFPAGRTATASGQLSLTQEERVAAIEGFLAAARDALRPMGCAVSADIFAIVVSMEDDQGLGQRPEEISRQVDALSPMVYPSHYSPGWLGFADPNDHPYEVTRSAILDAQERLSPGTILRPWLQAFWWSNAQIRSAIRAAEDSGVGWILWNIGSNYEPAAIPTDEELAAPS